MGLWRDPVPPAGGRRGCGPGCPGREAAPGRPDLLPGRRSARMPCAAKEEAAPGVEGILRLGTRVRPRNEGETAPWDAAVPEGWGPTSLDEAAPGVKLLPGRGACSGGSPVPTLGAPRPRRFSVPRREAFARGCGCVPGRRLRPRMRMRPQDETAQRLARVRRVPAGCSASRGGEGAPGEGTPSPG